MKKFMWISLVVVISFMLSSVAMAESKQTPPGQQGIVINGTIIHACYQKMEGQLRIVGDLGKCRSSEMHITLNSPPQPKTVFITSQTYVGGLLGGIAEPMLSATHWQQQPPLFCPEHIRRGYPMIYSALIRLSHIIWGLM